MTAHPVSEDVPPDPAALIESMRAFGYSLPAAIADLVDNSLSAGAKAIDVQFHWSGATSFLTVADNGSGMDESGLRNAMRLGSKSPTETRAADDLGRFGLGLKSAAFSQGRSLTVATRRKGSKNAETLVRRWDLDHVEAEREWSLLTSPTDQGAGILATTMPKHGTVVLVEALDRLVGTAASDDQQAHDRFRAQIRRVESHLQMVFHRFLSGRGRVSMTVNGADVSPWDPFLEAHSATQVLPGDTYNVEGSKVVVQPFVLPHYSKLTETEHKDAGGTKGWNAHQGFYVYRGRRLLVAGEWLGLPRMQQEEHYKLARIRIDLDNDMDELWQIDVRKATARPPGALHAQLKAVAESCRRRASEAYRYRGKITARGRGATSLQFVWARTQTRDGFVYRLNREHHLVEALLSGLGKNRGAGEKLLRIAEENIPLAAILVDARENPTAVDDQRPFARAGKEVEDMLRGALSAMVDAGASVKEALDLLAGMEPFNFHPELVGVIREEHKL